MKKILITMLVLLLLLTSTCFAREFTDLDESHWAYSVITKMSKEGILNGFPDGTFGPNQPITRAEFSKILVLSLDRNIQSTEEFKDVSKSHWAYSYIKVASNYLEGSDEHFYPDEKAVREDIVKAMVLAAGFQDKEYDLETLNQFSDKGYISSNMKKYVAIAVENELFRGNADGTFNPQGRLTRAEVCQVMFNISKVLEEEEENKPAPTKAPTKTITPTITPTTTKAGLLGDATEDGVVDPIDATTIDRYCLGKVTTINEKNADVNVDGKITPDDAEIIRRYFVGLIKELPYKGSVAIGDVDGNGEVNEEDQTVLSRYIAGWDGYEDKVNKQNADVDADGEVTARDRMILARHLAGWEGYEKLPYTEMVEDTEEGLLGDATEDGVVDSIDATAIDRYCLGKVTTINEKNADVNADGKITPDDAEIIRRYFVGSIKELPYKGSVAIGDVDGNGEVNEEDQTVLSRYIAGWDGYEDKVNKQNADVDADGEVTARDSMILARHLAGWEGFESLPYTK